MSVSAAIAEATAALTRAGVASARTDAELLAAHVLGTTRGRLLLAPHLTEKQLQVYTDLVAERGSRVPLQYLTGRAAFRHLDLAVGPGVFIPRPETELLVDWGLRFLRSAPDVPTVVDLCAGSGAIALAVATEHPDARVYAVEREPAALNWLRRNVSDVAASAGGVSSATASDTDLGSADGADPAPVAPPVTVVAGDVTDPAVLAHLDGRVDLVLCNPPYVPLSSAGRMPTEVTDHDPAAAVFGGPDGLDLVRPLLDRVAALLGPGGGFGVEHDDTHGGVVPALLRADGRFDDVRLHHDLAGRPRFTTAVRSHGWQDGAP
jgi:release factor glutamine methyltransferase